MGSSPRQRTESTRMFRQSEEVLERKRCVPVSSDSIPGQNYPRGIKTIKTVPIWSDRWVRGEKTRCAVVCKARTDAGLVRSRHRLQGMIQTQPQDDKC